MLSEIGALVDDLVPDWANTLPSHVTDAYSGKGSRPLTAPVIRVCWTPSATPARPCSSTS